MPNSMRQRPVHKCFACGRKLGSNPYHVVTEDNQVAEIGSECYKLCKRSDGLWQPPAGGPKVRPITAAEWTEHIKRLDMIRAGRTGGEQS